MGTEWWMAGSDTNNFSVGCHRFCLKTSELSAEVSRLLAGMTRGPEAMELVIEMARKVQAVDQELATWLLSVPEEFRFRTLCWIWEDEIQMPPDAGYGGVDVFPGRVDVYPNFIIANVWNMARISRIMLACLNIRLAAWLCSPIDYRTTSEYNTSRRICEGTISEIMASIPYHLGWHTRRHERFDDPSWAGFACGEEEPVKVLPAFFAMWSLTVIQNHDITTEDQRAWAKGRLKFIEEELGLKYAGLLRSVRQANPPVPQVPIFCVPIYPRLFGREGLAPGDQVTKQGCSQCFLSCRSKSACRP
jgi:hypothetical protein